MSDQPFRFLDEEPPAVTPSPAPAAPPGAPPPEAEPGWAPTLLEPEPDAPTELADNWAPGRIDIPAGPARSVGLAVAGLAVLIVTWALCSIVSFIISLAAHSLWLAAPALVAMLAGLGLIIAAGRVELRGYRRLAEVEKLRLSLADNAQPIAAVRADAIDWIGHVPSLEAERVALTQALGAATTHAELRAILRSRVVAKLAARAAEIGKRAALEGAAMIAISPHKSWDGLIAGLRGLAVIRQVARLHGIRPGPAVTFTLLRHVVATAAGTAGIELLSQTVEFWHSHDKEQDRRLSFRDHRRRSCIRAAQAAPVHTTHAHTCSARTLHHLDYKLNLEFCRAGVPSSFPMICA